MSLSKVTKWCLQSIEIHLSWHWVKFAGLLVNHMQFFIENGSWPHEKFTDLVLLDFKCRLCQIIMYVNQIVLNYVKYYSAFNMQNTSIEFYCAEFVQFN